MRRAAPPRRRRSRRRISTDCGSIPRRISRTIVGAAAAAHRSRDVARVVRRAARRAARTEPAAHALVARAARTRCTPRRITRGCSCRARDDDARRGDRGESVGGGGRDHRAARDRARRAVRPGQRVRASACSTSVDRVSPARHDELHQNAINVYLPRRDGVRLTAARTLSPDPSYRQLSVRRLMTMLRRVLYRQMQWAVFEPNDARLRGDIRNQLEAYLRQLFAANAFAGARAEDAFFVRCDDDLNPQPVVDQGRLLRATSASRRPSRSSSSCCRSRATATARSACRADAWSSIRNARSLSTFNFRVALNRPAAVGGGAVRASAPESRSGGASASASVGRRAASARARARASASVWDGRGSSGQLGDGGFQECTGLQIEMDVHEITEGGRNDGVVRLVGRGKYTNDRAQARHALSARRHGGQRAVGVAAGHALRPAADRALRRRDRSARRDRAAASSRRGCSTAGCRRRSMGPSLNAKTGEIAIEELTIAHEGLRLRI